MMKKHLILVVEDDPTLRMLTQKQLAKLGFECVAVCTGEEAVEHDRSSISLIFMDIGLPGIDGCHSTMLIRANEQTAKEQRIPIVALTAHSDREKCIAAGMDDFLQKPALLADLQRVIDKWVAAPVNGKLA